MHLLRRLSAAAALTALALAAPTATWAAVSFSGTTLLSTTQIPTGTRYDGNLVFGLSGIDYNAATNSFISERDNYLAGAGNDGNPVAFTLTPVFTPGQPGFQLSLSGVNTLGGAKGLSSAESIRYDPAGNGVWLSTEEPNAIFHVDASGTRTRLALPNSVAGRTPAGSANFGLEGMTFTPGDKLWVSRENAMSGDAADLIRLSNIAPDGSLLRQYAYRLDDVVATNRNGAPIANRPGPGVANNGVSEILAVSDTEFLVMERAFDGIPADTAPQGLSHNYIRIYSVDLSSGTDVSSLAGLAADGAYRVLTKTLLFDSQSPAIAGALDTYDTKVDNLEGMTFGPTLANGQRSLVLVSDNNNSSTQRKTQFLVLGLAPAVPEPATWATMTLGFGLIGWAMRRRGPDRAAVLS